MDKRVAPPLVLTEDERAFISGWVRARYPKLHRRLPELWGDCRDFYIMKGEEGYQLEDGGWAACFRRWIRREAQPNRHQQYVEATRGSSERPQELRRGSNENFTRLKSILGGRAKTDGKK